MNQSIQTLVCGTFLLVTTFRATGAEELASREELYAGKEFSKAFVNPPDDPERPNVLLIGDSISIGYTVEVRKRLKGKADVYRIPTNGKFAAYGLDNLDLWLGGRSWDVIHYNWGLWDICYRNPESTNQGHRDKVSGTLTATPDQYRQSMEKIVSRFRKTDAKLIWCSTTPVPECEAGRKAGDEIKCNLIAEKIMKKHGISINDLHAYALLRLSEIQQKKGDVHFSAQGYSYLAEKVVLEVSTTLSE
ncbi:SGNH/GDSL hydrolase family protein [Pontiella sulfatireligans]|uniref:SGNH hydrolase-type esterase domain-containing protein n=1 Tax=Pontiella sulfatireligans TaxID=2750658 RepID=A0A6C2UGU8_9BACT|nr:SGNH/GDSL hydrolase family protein [Pontiella sulfatireligans]VGO19410.1 hypothetical protein SCARR_01468 [Pontiella sulfatireligans]